MRLRIYGPVRQKSASPILYQAEVKITNFFDVENEMARYHADLAHVELSEWAGQLQVARDGELGQQHVQLVHLEETGLDLRHHSLHSAQLLN